jgi:hypothetical protein
MLSATVTKALPNLALPTLCAYSSQTSIRGTYKIALQNYREQHCYTSVHGTANFPYRVPLHLSLPNYRTWHRQIWHCPISVRMSFLDVGYAFYCRSQLNSTSLCSSAGRLHATSMQSHFARRLFTDAFFGRKW